MPRPPDQITRENAEPDQQRQQDCTLRRHRRAEQRRPRSAAQKIPRDACSRAGADSGRRESEAHLRITSRQQGELEKVSVEPEQGQPLPSDDRRAAERAVAVQRRVSDQTVQFSPQGRARQAERAPSAARSPGRAGRFSVHQQPPAAVTGQTRGGEEVAAHSGLVLLRGEKRRDLHRRQLHGRQVQDQLFERLLRRGDKELQAQRLRPVHLDGRQQLRGARG